MFSVKGFATLYINTDIVNSHCQMLRDEETVVPVAAVRRFSGRVLEIAEAALEENVERVRRRIIC